MERIYTSEEVAEKLGLKKTTVWKYIRTGKIGANKFGTHYRITQQQLDHFLESTSIVQQTTGTNPQDHSNSH